MVLHSSIFVIEESACINVLLVFFEIIWIDFYFYLDVFFWPIFYRSFLSFLALLSISIGLLNLVPLPMLDGGQLLYDAWELLSGRRISVELQGVFQRFGFILIIALTIFALFNDLQRFFPSSWFVPFFSLAFLLSNSAVLLA